MKVLHVTNAYPSKQSPIYGIFIKEQIESLTKPGSKERVFYINAKHKGKIEYLISYIKLLFIVRKYDIIHCHHVFCALVVLLTLPKAKVLVSFLSDGPKEFTFKSKVPFSKTLYKYILRKSDGRIFKSPVPEFLSNDKYTFHLPNGVNTDLFAPMNKEEAKRTIGLDLYKKYILFVSSNNINRPEKRYDIFKKILDLLKTKYKYHDLEELLLVNVERDKIPFYFNSSELHLLTSDAEGSPNSVKESLSCNIPVISTAVGNVKDMLQNVPNCYVSTSNDPEELAKYCHEILNFKNSYNIREYIFKKKLDAFSISKELEKIYMLLYEGR
jgi:teichuronic acid biosynthesis glycosyltransferase TuaC